MEVRNELFENDNGIDFDFGEAEEEEEQLEPVVKEVFKIDSLEKTAWGMKKIIALNKKDAEINEYAEGEISKIKEWQEKQIKANQYSREYFEAILAEYYYRLREKNPKQKPITTPYGSVSSKKIPVKWVYDDVTLVDWLRENNPNFIKTIEEPKRAELKETLKVTGNVATNIFGEIVPGITILDASEKIIIKVVDK